MLCESCGQRKATVHYTEIINGQKRESHLCEVCAGELHSQSFNFPPQLNLHHFLAGLLNHEFGESDYSIPAKSGKKCDKCGIVEEQFIKQGLLGCGDCYPYFGDKLQPLLRRIHGNNRHTGKVPVRTGGRARVVKEIEDLKSKLKTAVEHEEFELAVKYRDSIRALEGKLQHEGGEV